MTKNKHGFPIRLGCLCPHRLGWREYIGGKNEQEACEVAVAAAELCPDCRTVVATSRHGGYADRTEQTH